MCGSWGISAILNRCRLVFCSIILLQQKKYPTTRAKHCWNTGFSCLSSSCTPSHIPSSSGCSQGGKISSSYLPNSGWYLLYVSWALCLPKDNHARDMFCCNWRLTVTWKQIEYIFHYLCSFSCRNMTTFNLILYVSLQYSLCHTPSCKESAYRFLFKYKNVKFLIMLSVSAIRWK